MYQAQSLGLDLNLNYSIGIFYFAPEFYIDYYLPKTNDKRVTQIFNLNTGITFLFFFFFPLIHIVGI